MSLKVYSSSVFILAATSLVVFTTQAQANGCGTQYVCPGAPAPGGGHGGGGHPGGGHGGGGHPGGGHRPNPPSYPGHPTQPNPPNYPNYPTYPSQPTYPTYPTYPSQPTYPTYPTYPSQPTYPTYPSQPYPTYPTQPSYPYADLNVSVYRTFTGPNNIDLGWLANLSSYRGYRVESITIRGTSRMYRSVTAGLYVNGYRVTTLIFGNYDEVETVYLNHIISGSTGSLVLQTDGDLQINTLSIDLR